MCEGGGRRKSSKWQAGNVELCGSSNGTTGRSTKEVSCSERKVSRDREDADQEVTKYRLNQTGGWEEKQFDRGEVNCTEGGIGGVV